MPIDKLYPVDVSETALFRLKAIAVAGIQVRQENVKREDILKSLAAIPLGQLLKVSEDIDLILKGEKVIL